MACWLSERKDYTALFCRAWLLKYGVVTLSTWFDWAIHMIAGAVLLEVTFIEFFQYKDSQIGVHIRAPVRLEHLV